MLAFLATIKNEEEKNKLEVLYDEYHKELLYIAYCILKDYHEAEDVVQSAMMKIFDYLDAIEEIECNKTKAFVVIITRNLAINRYNQRKRQTTVNIETIEQIVADEKQINPEQHVLRLDQSEWVARQLALIKAEYADILTLRYAYDYTNQEISQLLNMTDVNVRVTLSRARKALHGVIRRCDDEQAN
jgi:RNA polymerase sigma-70 factor (ECF subfamily)